MSVQCRSRSRFEFTFGEEPEGLPRSGLDCESLSLTESPSFDLPCRTVVASVSPAVMISSGCRVLASSSMAVSSEKSPLSSGFEAIGGNGESHTRRERVACVRDAWVDGLGERNGGSLVVDLVEGDGDFGLIQMTSWDGYLILRDRAIAKVSVGKWTRQKGKTLLRDSFVVWTLEGSALPWLAAMDTNCEAYQCGCCNTAALQAFCEGARLLVARMRHPNRLHNTPLSIAYQFVCLLLGIAASHIFRRSSTLNACSNVRLCWRSIRAPPLQQVFAAACNELTFWIHSSRLPLTIPATELFALERLDHPRRGNILAPAQNVRLRKASAASMRCCSFEF